MAARGLCIILVLPHSSGAFRGTCGVWRSLAGGATAGASLPTSTVLVAHAEWHGVRASWSCQQVCTLWSCRLLLPTGQPGEHLLRCYALALGLRRVTSVCILQESR
eukprot:4116811-Alexandrium_andersonii.AAC.1